MKCFNHREVEAIAVCVNCGMALCDNCALRSKNGRLVCSESCAVASKQMEEFISSTRNKTVRGAWMTAYFLFGIAPILILMGIASYFDLHALPLLVFLVAVGIVFVVIGFGQTQVAKRNSAAGKD